MLIPREIIRLLELKEDIIISLIPGSIDKYNVIHLLQLDKTDEYMKNKYHNLKRQMVQKLEYIDTDTEKIY